jgi:hypothetical protein
VAGGDVDKLPIKPEDTTKDTFAQPHGSLGDGIEDWLHVRR